MFRNFTVLSRVTFWTGTLIFVRAGVATRPSIQTRRASATVVEIFIAELATPVGFTETLPWFIAGTMDTAWVWNALIAVLALPAILTPALSRNLAGPMFRATTLTTDGFVAVKTRPAFQASFVAILITGVVPKEVISWSTKLVAAKAIVVFVTSDPDLVLKVSYTCVLLQRLPLAAWVDHTRVRCFLYNAIRINTVVTVIPGLNKQRVGSRPSKTEREYNPVLFVIPTVF